MTQKVEAKQAAQTTPSVASVQPVGSTRTRVLTAIKWVPTLGLLITGHPVLFPLFICLSIHGVMYEYRLMMAHMWPQSGADRFKDRNGPVYPVPSTQLAQSRMSAFDALYFCFGVGLGLAAALAPSLFFFHAWTAVTIALLFIAYVVKIAYSGSSPADPNANSTGPETLHVLALYFLGLMWLAWPLAHATLMHRFGPQGVAWVMVILYGSWLGDAAGYFVGKRYGRTSLTTNISPNKSLEGFLANVVVSPLPLLACWAFAPSVFSFSSFAVYLGNGLLIGVLGPVGDLFESYLKRAAHVKDSGDFFKGHGGFLDRFDSFLLAGPVLFYYVMYMYAGSHAIY